mmetsp:Transcript_2192/g.3005  ORF Transcript_2192/g.3005 Transcript_2192/m.3005 type:complete len:310 (-) Transcript_2192:383-1312(-)
MVCDNTQSDLPVRHGDEISEQSLSSMTLKESETVPKEYSKVQSRQKSKLHPLYRPFASIYALIYEGDISIAKKHALYSAYLSILAGMLEVYLSVLAGQDDGSESVFGVAAMALIDTSGSALVVWRWQFASPDLKPTDLAKIEARCSIFIGFGMLVSVAMLLTSSFDSLVLHETPDGETEVFEVSIYTAAMSIFLFIYKQHVGHVLNSMVVLSDARSSLCAGLVALAVILSEGLQQLIWFADDVMGIMLSFYILYQAYTVIDGGLAELRKLSDPYTALEYDTKSFVKELCDAGSCALVDGGPEEVQKLIA